MTTVPALQGCSCICLWGRALPRKALLDLCFTQWMNRGFWNQEIPLWRSLSLLYSSWDLCHCSAYQSSVIIFEPISQLNAFGRGRDLQDNLAGGEGSHVVKGQGVEGIPRETNHAGIYTVEMNVGNSLCWLCSSCHSLSCVSFKNTDGLFILTRICLRGDELPLCLSASSKFTNIQGVLL